MLRCPLAVALASIVVCIPAAVAEEAQTYQAQTHTLRPANVGFSAERLRELKLPEGFEINVFARPGGNARMLAVGEDGTVYLTRRQEGDVLALRDTDGDGRSDEQQTVIEGLDGVHGIAIDGGRIYLAPPTEVWLIDHGAPDGEAPRPPRRLIGDLPDGGQHPNRTLAVRDNRLWISVGSSCNACAETNPEHATLLVAETDGQNRRIFAQGLRNTIGFGWHPQTGELWGFDHGSDMRGDGIPPEELNRLEEGEDYGWPYVYGKQEVDPVMDDPPGMSKSEYAEGTQPSVLEYDAHAAPIGMAFYDAPVDAPAAFPEAYRGDAFVAMRGSWNRQPPSGYKIVRVRFDDEGQPQAIDDFVTGFLLEDGRSHFARLAGVAVARDGALLFTDDTNGVIYRVAYTGE